MSDANAMRWDGTPGHYEVWYLSLTDPASGVGLWIRYTLLAPTDPAIAPTCALWCMAMDPAGPTLGRKQEWPIASLDARQAPFSLRVAEARLDDQGMSGRCADTEWDLRWTPNPAARHHVHPLLRRAGIAATVLTLPHADLEVSGTVRLGARELTLDRARGGQAHLWGTKHAARWAWVHASDLHGDDGTAAPGSFIDAVSVYVPRLGRTVGPSTPVLGRLLDEEFRSVSPWRVVANASRFGLTGWEMEARAGRRRVRMQVTAPRPSLVGVTYHDPDGETAHCYNSEIASMRLQVWDRSAQGFSGWVMRTSLRAAGRAHFEYGQRAPVAGVPILV